MSSATPFTPIIIFHDDGDIKHLAIFAKNLHSILLLKLIQGENPVSKIHRKKNTDTSSQLLKNN